MIFFKINRKILEWCQRRNNNLYEKNGFTDKILENQIRINKIRAEKDVTDNTQTVGEDGYVQ